MIPPNMFRRIVEIEFEERQKEAERRSKMKRDEENGRVFSKGLFSFLKGKQESGNIGKAGLKEKRLDPSLGACECK